MSNGVFDTFLMLDKSFLSTKVLTALRGLAYTYGMPEYISLKEASALLGLSESTVRRLFDSGDLAGSRTPKGTRKILKSSAETLCAQMNPEKGISFPPKE